MTAEELAHALGAKKSGRQWVCRCVAHEDSSPSMIIFDGRQHVQVRCLAGCEPEAIIDVLRHRGLWDNDGKQNESPKRVRRDDEAKYNHRMRMLARGLFDEAKPIRGSLAELYLESRDLYSVALMIDDIRYHPMCPRYSGPQHQVQPAIIVAMRSIETNAVAAIQRIYLTRTGKKDGKGMMLAPTGGTAMKLQHLQDHSLHVCEGLETALALIAQDKGPVWALGSTSNMQTFPVIASVDDLYIWADHDPIDSKTGKSPGIHAAAVCEARWKEAHKNAVTYRARTISKDCADVWSDRCGRL